MCTCASKNDEYQLFNWKCKQNLERPFSLFILIIISKRQEHCMNIIHFKIWHHIGIMFLFVCKLIKGSFVLVYFSMPYTT